MRNLGTELTRPTSLRNLLIRDPGLDENIPWLPASDYKTSLDLIQVESP